MEGLLSDKLTYKTRQLKILKQQKFSKEEILILNNWILHYSWSLDSLKKKL